jgi:hypothetical protein
MNDKLKVWGDHLIEHATLDQAHRTARLGVVEGVRLMPDAHIGKGATVGSVVATRHAIIPAPWASTSVAAWRRAAPMSRPTRCRSWVRSDRATTSSK